MPTNWAWPRCRPQRETSCPRCVLSFNRLRHAAASGRNNITPITIISKFGGGVYCVPCSQSLARETRKPTKTPHRSNQLVGSSPREKNAPGFAWAKSHAPANMLRTQSQQRCVCWCRLVSLASGLCGWWGRAFQPHNTHERQLYLHTKMFIK